jgi:arylamine N-acetyltransferase
MLFNATMFKRYLNILGINHNEPSINALYEIVNAHLTKVPFENVSKLCYKKQGLKHLPDLPTFLDGVEKYNFGGTCYTNNYYLYLLLMYLSYDVKLCGADMNNPDVHLVSIVNIGEKEFIADVGYAAPFFQPLPRDFDDDYNIEFGEEKYILNPVDENNYSKMKQYWKGDLKHGYTAKPQPRKIEEFQNVIENSYSEDATFMNAVMIARFYENSSLVLRNLTLTKTENNKTTAQRIERDTIPATVEHYFGMPRQFVEEAINELGELKDTWN